MSRIIAIGSGKGGVGKTWLAISASQALAALGRRVLLFDGDLGLANVDIQLGLGEGRDLVHVLAGQCPLENAVRRVESGCFDVVPGRSGSGRLASLAPPLLNGLLQSLERVGRAYDDVLIDLPAGLDFAVRRVFARAALPLVVTTDEPTSITDAYALIKVQRGAPGAATPSVVVNLAPSHEAGRDTHAGLERVCRSFLKLAPPLVGVLRRDPHVPDAIRHQVPFLVRHPSSPAASDVEALALELVVDPCQAPRRE